MASIRRFSWCRWRLTSLSPRGHFSFGVVQQALQTGPLNYGKAPHSLSAFTSRSFRRLAGEPQWADD